MPPLPGRLLLVGWEVGDVSSLHPLVDSGELPTVGRLLETGVGGALAAPRPLVDATLWASLVTGKRAWQHGVLAPSRGSASGLPDNPHSRLRSVALWDILARQSLRSLVVGWPAGFHRSAAESVVVSDRFAVPTAPPGQTWPSPPPGTYDPAERAGILDPCRIRPDQIGADAIAEFVPEWQTVDQSRDPRLAQLRVLLAADLSHHAALSALMASGDWTLAAVRFRGLAEIWRLFGADHLAAKGPFRHVVRAAYGLLDRLLEALIAPCGPEAGVALVTASGVEISPDRQRFSASPHGFGVFSGPGFLADELLHGASALDVVPTLLHWLKLPVGEDMEGRVLREGFVAPGEIPARSTWNPADIALPDPAELSDPNLLWNYATSCLDGSRPDRALPALERLFGGFPENAQFAETLFKVQLARGACDDAERTFSILREISGPTAGIRIAEAELAMVRKDPSRASEIVRSVLDEGASLPLGLWRRIGLLLAGLRRWEELEKISRRLLQQNDGDEIAWLALAESSLRLGHPAVAAASAREAIRRRFFFPEAHFALARALARDRKPLAAIEATERLLKIHPTNSAARIYLRRLRRSIASPGAEPVVQAGVTG